MARHSVEINKEKCIGCGLCVKDCPSFNIIIKEGKASKRFDHCIFCGHCSAICPQNAIELMGYEDERIEKPAAVGLDPEKVLDVIRFRRSVRQFKEDKIPDTVLANILEAGRLTHTAKNKQDVSYVVLDKEKDALEKMAIEAFKTSDFFSEISRYMSIIGASRNKFLFFGAPTVIVIAAKERTDALLAAQNMEFVAEAYGLGVCFSGYFTVIANLSQEVKEKLDFPEDRKVTATLVIGYPKVEYLRSAPREPLDVKFM